MLHIYPGSPKWVGTWFSLGFPGIFLCVFLSQLWPHRVAAFVPPFPVSNSLCYWVAKEWPGLSWRQVRVRGAAGSLHPLLCPRLAVLLCLSLVSLWGGGCHFQWNCSAPWAIAVSSAGSVLWLNLCGLSEKSIVPCQCSGGVCMVMHWAVLSREGKAPSCSLQRFNWQQLPSIC